MPQSDHKTATEIELERLESKLRTVQLALEILIGVCATLPDPGPELGAEDPDNDDEGNARIYYILHPVQFLCH
jgi:hypothetical protein